MTSAGAEWQKYWEAELEELESEGRRRRLRHFVRRPEAAAEIESNGRRIVNFGSNDYLNLSCHPTIARRVQESVEMYGWGSGASPLVSGRTPAHFELEKTISEFEATEAALLFSTGYAANVAAIVTLVGRGDGIYSDQLNHASLIDGCRLSGAEICRYRHVDVADLAEQLAAHRSRFRRAIIVTDSLFSMDGDLAPLKEICDLADRFDCLVVADEAHATGVYGENGEGWVQESGCKERVHVRTGTMSKAVGGLGGFLVGPQSFIDLAMHRGRGYMFSTSMPAVIAQTALASFELIKTMSQERKELRNRAVQLRKALREQGWNVGGTDSPIVPIFVGDANLCVAYSMALMTKNCYVPGIRPPTVPTGKSLLRISLTTAHTDEHIQQLLRALRELMQADHFSMQSASTAVERDA